MDLSNNEKRMLKALRSRPAETWTLDEVLSACQWDDQAYVAGSGLALAEHGLVDIDTTKSTIWSLGPEGLAAIEQGLLEQRIWDWLQGQSEDERGMKDLQASGITSKQETGVGIGLLKGLGCALEQGRFSVPDNADAIIVTLVARKSFLEQCQSGANESDLDGDLLAHFKKR